MAATATSINAGAVEAATIGIALAVVAIKIFARWKLNRPPVFDVGKCTIDLLNGGTVFPFLLMIGAVFFDPVFDYLKSATPGTTALAGSVGLFFVLGELSKIS